MPIGRNLHSTGPGREPCWAPDGPRGRGYPGPGLVVLLLVVMAVAAPFLEQPGHRTGQVSLSSDGFISSLAFGPRGDWFYAGHTGIGPTMLQLGPEGRLDRGPTAGVGRCDAMALDPAGRSLVVARPSGAIEIRDPETLDLVRTVAGHGDRVMCLSFSDDGEQLVSVDDRGICRHWSVADGRMTWQYDAGGGLSRCAFSPDGLRVALGLQDGRIAVLDAPSGAELASWEGHVPGRSVLSLAFDPGGRSLISLGMDGRLRTWDATEGWSPMLTIPMIGGTSGSLAVAPDGRGLATGHNDGRVRFWDLASGDLLRETPVDGVQLQAVSFTPDGRRLAVALGPQVVLIEAQEAA